MIGSAVVTTLLALYAWRHRSVPGAGPFAGTMLLATLWAVAYTVETVTTDLGSWLCLVPTITVLLAWTSDLHNLIRYDVHLDTDGPFPVVWKSCGFWFWTHSAYSCLLFSSCIALLAKRLLRTPSLCRGQLLPLLFGMLLPMTGSASYWLGFNPIRHFDPGPVLLGISGCMVAWALFRFRLFDIVPIAHDRVIDGMGDGVIVLDTRGQIAEFNLAAGRVFGRNLSETVGRSFAETFSAWPELVALSRSPRAAHTDWG
ncbi:MAG: histidine kinase N-terminal 7TM domain-containing protein [Chloroflexota bacterium]